ncbi:MAG TPA: flagellar biosynthetic protein FliO, partial [Halomonas sp.]|nr:flagellar biosynthetic protein FliO [Halomonas sp.]HBN60187.1 flagellar biosynthetic protein FliO [Halomonas sp.]
SKLHERPAPTDRTSSTPPRPPTRFSQRLANAIANSRGKGDSTSSDSQHTS